MNYQISPVVRVVAYILVITVALALIFVAILSGQCDPRTTNCSTDFLYRLAALNYAYFFIPVTLSIASIVGSLALLLDMRRNELSHS